MSPHIVAGPAGSQGGLACVLEPPAALSTAELTRHSWGRCSAELSASGGGNHLAGHSVLSEGRGVGSRAHAVPEYFVLPTLHPTGPASQLPCCGLCQTSRTVTCSCLVGMNTHTFTIMCVRSSVCELDNAVGREHQKGDSLFPAVGTDRVVLTAFCTNIHKPDNFPTQRLPLELSLNTSIIQ